MSNKLINKYIIYNTLIVIGTTFFNPILYLYLENSQFSYSEIGLYLSVFWIITFIFEIPAGIFCDLFGYKYAILISCLLRYLGLFVLVDISSFSILIVSALLTGIAESFMSGTLSSWFVNENNKLNSELNLQTAFSKAATISSIFSAIIGFFSAQILFVYNAVIPIKISAIYFLGLFVFFIFSFPKSSINFLKSKEKDKINILKNSKINFDIILMFIIMTIPSIIDLGPSNQWQSFLNANLESYINGYVWIIIMFISMLANLVISKLENYDLSKYYEILIVFDCVIIFIIPYFENVLIGFCLHVFMFSLLFTISKIYMHKHIITNDSLRTSFVSLYNTFESLIVSILLYLNGVLSDAYGIAAAWNIISLVSLIILGEFSILKKANRVN